MEQPTYRRFRIINTHTQEILPEWSLNLIPQELRDQWDEFTRTSDYMGVTPEIVAMNKKRPVPERIEEWMTNIYTSMSPFETRDYYKVTIKPHQNIKGATRNVCTFRIPSSVDVYKYVVTEDDANKGASAGLTIANKLKVTLEDLRSWNKDKRLEPPRVGDVVNYQKVNYDKVIIVNDRIANELERFTHTGGKKEIFQTRTSAEIAAGEKEFYKGGLLYIEEIEELPEGYIPEIREEPKAPTGLVSTSATGLTPNTTITITSGEKQMDGTVTQLDDIHAATKSYLAGLEAKTRDELRDVCRESHIKFKGTDGKDDLIVRIKAFAYETGLAR